MKKVVTIFAATILTILLAGCGNSLDGKYVSTSQHSPIETLEFTSGKKVTLDSFIELNYEIDGKTLEIKDAQRPITMKIENDGSLTSIFGVFKKKS